MAAEALRGGGTEVAYELRRLLGRTEHPEISVALEHAVELFTDELLAEASRLFLHPGVHDARIDAHYGDAVRTAFQGQNAGELVEGRLRGAVGGHPCDRVPGGGAGDVHYASPVRRDHAGERFPGAQKGPGHVDVEGAPPRIRSRGRYGERDAGRARVVYEDGDVTEFAAHPLETGRDRVLVGHVQFHGQGCAAARGDLLRHGGDLLLRAGGEGDGGALACEQTGRRRPDSTSRAGY